MSTDDTNAARRGSGSNDLLGPQDTAHSEMLRLLDLSARQAAEIERLRAAGARLYAAIGDALPSGPLPQDLMDAGQAWTDASKA